MRRIYQDFSFVVTEVIDRPLLRLCGSVDIDTSEKSPIVVFARLDAPLEWHRFFLDAGAAFWEICLDSDIDDEYDDSIRSIDYFSELMPCKIKNAKAFAPLPSLPTRIVLQLDNEYSIQLSCIGDVYDALTQILIEQNSPDL